MSNEPCPGPESVRSEHELESPEAVRGKDKAPLKYASAKELIGQIADMVGVPKRIAWLRVTCDWQSDEFPLIEYRLAQVKKEESPESL